MKEYILWYLIPRLCYLLLSALVIATKGLEYDDNNGECSICLDNLKKEGEECVTTYECNHNFHLKCLNSWVKTRPSCPLCRHDLRVVKV